MILMGGSNPYLDADVPEPASQPFKTTFQPVNVSVDVDPEKIPYGVTGLPGSILDIALGNGVDIDHSCGGVCACSTCHVIVREGFDTLSEMSDGELDQLAHAPGLTPKSRLSCQAVSNGTKDIVVEIPSWNRNAVREGH